MLSHLRRRRRSGAVPTYSRLGLILSLATVICMASACGRGSSAEKLLGKSSSNGSTPSQPAGGNAIANAVANSSGTDVPFNCSQPKSATEFVTTMSQDFFRRGPTAAELAMAQTASFTPETFVDYAFAQPDYNTGVAYFVSNLFRLEENLAVGVNNQVAADAAILSDLKQEPVLLVQANKTAPWPSLFTTQDIYCSALTGPLYSYPVDPTISGFVSCKLPPERAGLLGLVSVLRAFSSSYFITNSNRHRVALALYLGQGLQIQAKTTGPTGSGTPPPLAACVPEIDTRVSSTGAVFGTAAVPKVGPVCASCHVPYMAPMEPAFLRFGLNGETLGVADVAKFPGSMTNGISTATLTEILENGNESCFSPDSPQDPPQEYTGLPGLARLLAGSTKLPTALAIQVQQNLLNITPTAAMTAAITSAYAVGGQSLDAALRGLFLSAPYQCAVASGG